MPTQAAVAKHLDLSMSGVRDLIGRGIIPEPKDSTIDLVRVAYIRHIRAVASGHTSADGDLDLTGERARLAKEQADAQALKNAELRGELVRGDAVESWLVRLLGAVVQRIRAIAPKAAPEVRATVSDAEGESLLARFHDEALSEIADALRDAADTVARLRSRAVASGNGDGGGSRSASPEADGERVGRRGEDAKPGVERGAGAVADGAG